MANKTIAVIGTGYVGLVAGACLAFKGHKVTCFDINEKRIKDLSQGIIPFYEPGLEEKVKTSNLNFSLVNEDLLDGFEAIFISVGTPDDGSGKTDLSQVKSALDFVIKKSEKKKIIIIRSTVPAGTCTKLQEYIASKTEIQHVVCSNPEFTKEGDAINDFEKPERVVVGVPDISDSSLIDFFTSIYEDFIHKDNILFMSTESSELTKYASNAFLATKISFINDIARLCDKLNANIEEVSLGMGKDSRIGSSFLNSGLGYGGSCFPKDTLSLQNQANVVNESLYVLDGTIISNRIQIDYFFQKILNYFESKKLKKIITILGLSFKPETDDTRESRGLILYQLLLDRGFQVKCYDKMHLNLPENLSSLNYSKNMENALSGSNAVVITVEDNEFKKLDSSFLKKLGIKVVFDGRNILNGDHINKEIDYISIGKG